MRSKRKECLIKIAILLRGVISLLTLLDVKLQINTAMCPVSWWQAELRCSLQSGGHWGRLLPGDQWEHHDHGAALCRQRSLSSQKGSLFMVSTVLIHNITRDMETVSWAVDNRVGWSIQARRSSQCQVWPESWVRAEGDPVWHRPGWGRGTSSCDTEWQRSRDQYRGEDSGPRVTLLIWHLTCCYVKENQMSKFAPI